MTLLANWAVFLGNISSSLLAYQAVQRQIILDRTSTDRLAVYWAKYTNGGTFALHRLGLAHALSSSCPQSFKKVYFLNERHTKFFKMAAKRTPEVTSHQCAYLSNSLALIVERPIVNQQKFTKFVLTKINM